MRYIPDNTVFVGNVPQEATQAEIGELAATYGSTGECNFPVDENGYSQGFCQFYTPSPEDRDAVILGLDEYVLHGRQLWACFNKQRLSLND